MIVYGLVVFILWALGHAPPYSELQGSGSVKGVLYGLLLWGFGLLPNLVALHIHTKIWWQFNWDFLGTGNLLRWVILGAVYGTIYELT